MRHLRTWAIAVAAIGAVLLGGSKQARADILITVSAGGTTDNFDFASNTSATTTPFTIDGYNTTIHTVVTNYPGSPSIGSITTTVNVGSTSGNPSSPLTTTVQLVSAQNSTNPFNSPLLAWTGGPTTPTVTVNSGASFTGNNTTTSGSTTTTTYFNSPPAGTFATSMAGPVGTQATPTSSSTVGSANFANTGTYTLSQVLVLTGLNVGAQAFNFGATSTVSPVASVPEPSTMALAGLGALGLISYGLRRRKATGA
jgi:hypothetical protein